MVSCTSSSSSRSAAAASSSEAAAVPSPAPHTCVLVRLAGAPSPSLAVESFSSALSLDADASERLLPRPALAAARAAAAAASGGHSPVAAPGGGVSHRRFLTLHRRKKRRPPAPMAPHRALLDDLYPGPTQSVLERVGEWNFNAFALDSVSGGRPVSVLCVYLLRRYGLIAAYNMDTVAVWKCFSLIEEGYHTTNPYHNAVHAADVTQAMHCYLQEEVILRNLTPLELLSSLLAAVCHDLDHPGVNQPFLIATDNHLAALYKNLSVLENHHWRCAMGCLWESGLLEGWAAEDVALLQEQIRSLILATDITRQQEFLTKFKKYQESGGMDMSDPECRHFSLQIALKCADICNPCRPWDVSRKWSQKICDEFYRQGDYERQLNIPVTALCDRYVTPVAKIQTGFIEYVVCPLFSAWHQWLGTPLSEEMMRNIRSNLNRWQDRLSEDTAAASHQQLSLTAPTEPQEVGAETEKLEDDEMEGAGSSSSSDEAVSSFVPSMPCPAQTVVGRRHSLPLNVPIMLPRTVIRRESLSSDGQHPIVLETIQMEGMALSSLTQPDSGHSGSPTEPGSMVSFVTKMEESSQPLLRRHQAQMSHPKSGRRRMSLPHLSTQQQRYKQQVSTLQPLPATPSLEELRVPGQPQGPPGDAPSSSSSALEGQQTQQSQGPSDCEPFGSSSQLGQQSAGCETSVGQLTHNSPTFDSQSLGAHLYDASEHSSDGNRLCDSSISEDSCANTRASISGKIFGNSACPSEATEQCTRSSSYTLAPFPCIVFCAPLNEKQKSFDVRANANALSSTKMASKPANYSRRASLDSNSCTNINLNDNLNVHNNKRISNTNVNLNMSESDVNLRDSNIHLPCLDVLAAPGKWTLKRGTGDKENRVPGKLGRVSLLARTRHWRSLTQDGDEPAEVRAVHLAKVAQQQLLQRGRRGSAPVLHVEGSRTLAGTCATIGDREGDASPDRCSARLVKRRASAPTHHLLQGRSVSSSWPQQQKQQHLASYDLDETLDHNLNECVAVEESIPSTAMGLRYLQGSIAGKSCLTGKVRSQRSSGRRMVTPFFRRASFGEGVIALPYVRFALDDIEDDPVAQGTLSLNVLTDETFDANLNPNVTTELERVAAAAGTPHRQLPERRFQRPPFDRTSSLPLFDSSFENIEEARGLLDNSGRLQPQLTPVHSIDLHRLRLQCHLNPHLAPTTARVDASQSNDVPTCVSARLALDTQQCDNNCSHRRCPVGSSHGPMHGSGGASTHRYGPYRDHLKEGGGGGGGGELIQGRRGSADTETFSDLWRYRQECGVSQDSSDDMGDWYSSSEGAVTPSTPICAPFLIHPALHMIHPTHRRGSLPCDFSFSGEARLLESS